MMMRKKKKVIVDKKMKKQLSEQQYNELVENFLVKLGQKLAPKLKKLLTKSKDVAKQGVDYAKKNPGKAAYNTGTTGLATYSVATDKDPFNIDSYYKNPDAGIFKKVPTNQFGFTAAEYDALDQDSKDYLSDLEQSVKSGDNLKQSKDFGKMAGVAAGVGIPALGAYLLKPEKKKKKKVQEKLTSDKMASNVSRHKNEMKRQKEKNVKAFSNQQQKMKQNEGFAGVLPKSQRQAFNELRKNASEVLGYKLTGESDIKVDIDNATIKENFLKKLGQKIIQKLTTKKVPQSKVGFKTGPDRIPKTTGDYAKDAITGTSTAYLTHDALTDPAYKELVGLVDREGDGDKILTGPNGEKGADLQAAETDAFMQGMKDVAGPAAALTGAGLLTKAMIDKKKKKKKENPEESYHYNKVVKKK
jgi:hypothetical protein